MNIIPQLSEDFFCIVHQDNIELAAVISSYISSPGIYIPFFEFPEATIGKVVGDDTTRDKHEKSRRDAYLFNVMVGNAFSKMGGTKNVIYGGLSDEQKSYLNFSFDDVNLIDIPDMSMVEMYLGGFTGNKPILSCQRDEIGRGLYMALREGARIRIDETVDRVKPAEDVPGGTVVIEDTVTVSTIIAVNYAYSVGANTRIVNPLKEREDEEIQYGIEQWQAGSTDAYNQLAEVVNSRVRDIDFKKYTYCTFFTGGIPYSVILKDIIPFSYVHLRWKMDRFLFYGIYAELNNMAYSAVVFSPQFFGEAEETSQVSDSLNSHAYFVKELLGREATASNLDMHVKDYPYDLLHICSHGGDVEGEYCILELPDDKGQIHTLEFDMVRTGDRHRGDKIILVPTKLYWRKYDGLEWNSPEYRLAGGIDQDLFVQFRAEAEKKLRSGTLSGIPREKVPNSPCVVCFDFPFQGMFDVCAGGRISPFIFNNACWSGYMMAEPFIDGGARGYIGTLWTVDNGVATKIGQEFYSTVYSSTIIDALYKAKKKTEKQQSENIYIFWGLHFSTIKTGQSVGKSKKTAIQGLMISHSWLVQKALNHIDAEIRTNSLAKARWISNYLISNFPADLLNAAAQEIRTASSSAGIT